MWTFFFILALAGVLALVFYLVIEVNELDKAVTSFAEEVRKHYGP